MIISGAVLLNKITTQSSVEKEKEKHRYSINALSVEDSELLRKKYIFRSISLLGIIFTLALGLLAYVDGNYKLTLILAGATFIIIVNYALMVKNIISYKLASDFIVYPLLLLMIYLVASGGIDNLGGLWIYSLPMIVLFLHGYKKGIIVLVLFLLMLVALLFIPDNGFLHTSYMIEYKIRLTLIFILVSLLTSAYAHSAQELFKKMTELTEELSEIAEEDQLTQLRNRRGVYHQLERIYAQAKRDRTDLGLIMCDIDHFKEVNDIYGHDAGDKVLIAVAELIKHTIRVSDLPARWGGEEFLIVLPNANKKEAYAVAEKIRKNILDLIVKHEDVNIDITMSLGVADIKRTKNVEELVKLADNYLYEAKRKGRNLTCPDAHY
jgi:diguanylate cyclase (GGDEF)-like protein